MARIARSIRKSFATAWVGRFLVVLIRVAGSQCERPVLNPAGTDQTSGRLAESFQSLILRVMYLKYGEQLGYLQQVANPLGKVGQLNSRARVMRGCVQSYQCSEPAGIDVIHFAEVQNDSLDPVRHCFLHFIAQKG